MKTITLLLLLFHIEYNYQNIDLKPIRNDFNKGVKDKNLCERYYNQLKSAKTPIEKGYGAAFQMFMAKHTANPIKKMNYFKHGKSHLETIIKENANDVELRFIRLCIQFYSPSYLGYSGNVDTDKQFVMNNLYKMKDKETKELIYKYLKGANMYTAQELLLLGR